ncbi:MAG: hypothetical protein IPL78_11130 [Chloroflexi bacterium]|nr:hypothetical protein [Chloroflexota bacterium]
MIQEVYRILEEEKVVTHRRANGWTENLAIHPEDNIAEKDVLYSRFETYLNALTGEPIEAVDGPIPLHAKQLIDLKTELLGTVIPQDETAYQEFVAKWTQLVGWGGWIIRGPETYPDPPKP